MQNNKSFNKMVWQFSHKQMFTGSKMIENSNLYIEALLFNEGFNSIWKIMKTMEIKIESYIQQQPEELVTRIVRRELFEDQRINTNSSGKESRKSYYIIQE